MHKIRLIISNKKCYFPPSRPPFWRILYIIFNFDRIQISQIRAAWLEGDGGAGLETDSVTVHKTPFTCCSVRNFAADGPESDVADLVTELGDLEFAEKSNDLYKFRQSADLARAKSCRIRAFRELMRTRVSE